MRPTRLSRAIDVARQDGRIDQREVNELADLARRDGHISNAERTVLTATADSLDEALRSELLNWLVAGASGRHIPRIAFEGASDENAPRCQFNTGILGLAGELVRIDSSLQLKGVAQEDGTLSLRIDGKTIRVPVRAGDDAVKIVSAIRLELPEKLDGHIVAPKEPSQIPPWRTTSWQAPQSTARLFIYRPSDLKLNKGERPLHVVVSGYGPFLETTRNNSTEMARRLAEEGLPGAIVEFKSIPVNAKSVDAFVDELLTSPPDVVLSLGMTPSWTQIEEVPTNAFQPIESPTEVESVGRPVLAGAPYYLKTDLPLDEINQTLKEAELEYPVDTSALKPDYQPDSSAYYCNYLAYRLAEGFGDQGLQSATTAGFMHVASEANSTGASLVLKATVDAHHRAQSKRLAV